VLEPSPDAARYLLGLTFRHRPCPPITRSSDAALVAEVDSVDKSRSVAWRKYTLARTHRAIRAAWSPQGGARAHPERYREGLTQGDRRGRHGRHRSCARKAFAAIEELAARARPTGRKLLVVGPDRQGALAVAGIAAAATGQVYLGLPCVITAASVRRRSPAGRSNNNSCLAWLRIAQENIRQS